MSRHSEHGMTLPGRMDLSLPQTYTYFKQHVCGHLPHIAISIDIPAEMVKREEARQKTLATMGGFKRRPTMELGTKLDMWNNKTEKFSDKGTVEEVRMEDDGHSYTINMEGGT